jgi:hypothetical protein
VSEQTRKKVAHLSRKTLFQLNNPQGLKIPPQHFFWLFAAMGSQGAVAFWLFALFRPRLNLAGSWRVFIHSEVKPVA